jgi:DNA-binding NarL/FixJ family response regulator
VKNHVHSILAKLKVTRRGEAAARERRGSTPAQLEAMR